MTVPFIDEVPATRALQVGHLGVRQSVIFVWTGKGWADTDGKPFVDESEKADRQTFIEELDTIIVP